MPEPTKCCCHAPDAYECLRYRYGRQPAPLDEEYLEEPCECACHQIDQDGYTEWDDKNQPAPERP